MHTVSAGAVAGTLRIRQIAGGNNVNPLIPLIYTLLALLAVGTSALTLTLALYRSFHRGR